jgi:hypothetical protein
MSAIAVLVVAILVAVVVLLVAILVTVVLLVAVLVAILITVAHDGTSFSMDAPIVPGKGGRYTWEEKERKRFSKNC